MLYSNWKLLFLISLSGLFSKQSVLDGYNGTVMAYGQTGTGKTYTLGRLGEEDTACRGIMVRAMEDILLNFSPDTDTISVSYFQVLASNHISIFECFIIYLITTTSFIYLTLLGQRICLQLYMETIQDLLDPTNDNISIVEDPKTGDVSLPGAIRIEIRDQQSFMELLRLGEAHRFAANTKLNTESSRSHAILMVTRQLSLSISLLFLLSEVSVVFSYFINLFNLFFETRYF